MKKVLLTSLSMAVVMAVLAAQAQAATTIAHYRFEGTSGPYIDETGNNNAVLGSSDLRVAGGADNNPVFGLNQSMKGAGQGSSVGIVAAPTTLTNFGAWWAQHTAEFSYLWDGQDTDGFNIMAGGRLGTGGNGESVYRVWERGSGFVFPNNASIGIEGAIKPGAGDTDFYMLVDLVAAQNAGHIGPASVQNPAWVDVAFIFKQNDAANSRTYVNGVEVTGTAMVDIDVSGPSPAGGANFHAFGLGNQVSSTTAGTASTFLGFDEFRISSGERFYLEGSDQLLMFPEPSTMALLALGGLMMLRRRKRA